MEHDSWTKARGYAPDTSYPVSSDTSPRDIADLYAEVAALALKLERTITGLGRLQLATDSDAGILGEVTECLVQAEITNRARRSAMLPPELFAEPAWDMLLELYRAQLKQYRVSVSSLCIASNVPATTALRWISEMEAKALLERQADKFDRRRIYVRLTEAGIRGMSRYFSNDRTVSSPCVT